MLKKAFTILSIAFSLSACSLVSANLQKTSPNVTASDNPSPSPEALVATPEASPSFMITPSNTPQSNPSVQASPENTNQVVLPYDPNIHGRLITDPETFSQKLELLFKKFVKDQFETTEEFQQRNRQEIQSFQEAEFFKLKETFVIETPFSSNDCTYNADERILTIENLHLVHFPDRTIIEVLPQPRSKVRYGENSRKFLLSFLSPTDQKLSDSDVTNYWLNRRNKIDINSGKIVVANLEPSYAKQLVTENRLVLTTYLTQPLFFSVKSYERPEVVGYLLGLRITNNQTNTVLWNLN